MLIVDDNGDVRESIRALLASEGYQTVVASGGRQAIAKQKREPADIILMDMKMSKMDGVETTREIRKFDPGVEVVGVTAYKADYHSSGRDVGIVKWVDKPILNRRRKELLAVIRKGIAESRRKILSEKPSLLADKMPAASAAELVSAIRAWQNRTDRTKSQAASKNKDGLETLGLLVGVALLIKDSPVAADVFSRVMFSEIGNASRVRRALIDAQASKVAANYVNGLRALERWAVMPRRRR